MEHQDIGYVDHIGSYIQQRIQTKTIDSAPNAELYISDRDLALLGLKGMNDIERQEELGRRQRHTRLLEEEMQAYADGKLGQPPVSEEFVRQVISEKTRDLAEIRGAQPPVTSKDDEDSRRALEATTKIIKEHNLKNTNAILGLEFDTPLEFTQQVILARTNSNLFTEQDREQIFKDFGIPGIERLPD